MCGGELMSEPVKVEKVLMVDDDANIRLITEMSLEGLTEWKVRQAGSGKEALGMVREERPDLILLDVMMPDMDGVTLFEEIKGIYEHNTPIVIFMTAKVLTQEVEMYREKGAAGVITKPFDPMTLPDQIYEILGSA